MKGVLEEFVESDSVLRNRMKELELSHRTLLGTTHQLNAKLCQIENANVRVKGRLRAIREDLINLVENQEKSEKKQKEKLHWLQEQLKIKEDEIKSQSEYFEHYKQRQTQQTAVLRERECYLWGEVSRLEKQVLDLNAHIAFLTSELEDGMVRYLHQRLDSTFSGKQGYNHSDVKVTELKTCIENIEQDLKSHLEEFHQNLKILREREEDSRRQQAKLLSELQNSQDTQEFLRKELEEACHHLYSLKLSEIKLQEKMEDLLFENRALKDQGMVKSKRKEEKDSQLKRLETGADAFDQKADLNQGDVQNKKRDPVLDSLRSTVIQTPVVMLRAKEAEIQGCSCDGLNQIEISKEPLHDSGAGGEVACLADIEQVALGTEMAGTLEDTFTLLRCTTSSCAAKLLPPCSERLTNNEASKDTKDDYNPLKEQAINLPAKISHVSVVDALIRKTPLLTLLETASYHISAVTTVKKVRHLNFPEANTILRSSGLRHVTEGAFSGKASALLCGIFTANGNLENHNMVKHWENKCILSKSRGENKCLNKVVDVGKFCQKIFRGRAKEEDEKAQSQQVTCVPEESFKVSNKTKLISPGKQEIEATDSLNGQQDIKNLSVHFKDLKKHFEGNPELIEKQANLSEICVSVASRVGNGEGIIKVEEKEEQPQKPTHQTNPCSNIGLKEKKDQTLELCDPDEKISSGQKITAENMQYAYSQKLLCSGEDRYPLLSAVQERAVGLSKLFLPGSNLYDCFCHLASVEASNECNVKIEALRKVVSVCFQRIFLLVQENEDNFKKVCMLQQENEKYAQMMCALEKEMDMHFQYILAVGEANLVSLQSLLKEKEAPSECYNNLPEENTMIPGTFFVRTFSKNLPYVEQKNVSSKTGSWTTASNKLPRSVSRLDERKIRYFQLLSDLKEEGSRCLKELAKLLQTKDKYVAKYDEITREREGYLQKISLLESEKEALLVYLAEMSCEQDKHRTLISELQECKASCYQTISHLQEEKCVLEGEIDRIKQATSEQLDTFQKSNADLTLENNGLKEFMSSLGLTYGELRKDKSLGIRTVKLKEQCQHGLKPKKVETACSVTQTEGVPVTDPSNYFPGKEGSVFEIYRVLKEQVEKANKELKIQEKELEKSKKEAQKWYRELGFAETRYEETKIHLTQALSELDRLKQEAGDKILRKQHCKVTPVFTSKDAQETEEHKTANKRLQQQVLTLKALLRDQTALQNEFRDLQNEVKVLQAQLCAKDKELQKKKSEVKLTLAPLKAKLACLTRKCQERNSFIMRMHGDLHRQGITNSAFDQEVKNLVNDIALTEYTVAFTAMCDQEVLPSSMDISQASGKPDHEMYVQVNGMTGSIPAHSQQELDNIPSPCIIPNVCAGSPINLTSPERIIALHQELRRSHHKTCQIPSVVSSSSNPKADCSLPMIHEEDTWPVLSRMKDARVPPEQSAFWATKGRDQLSKRDDVFWGQIGNQ